MKINIVAIGVLISLFVFFCSISIDVVATNENSFTLIKVDNTDTSIQAINPENHSQIILANDLVYEYYSSYDYTKSFPDKYYQSKDIFAPNSISLEWSDCGADYYIVRLSQKSDMSDSKYYITNAEKLALDDLFTETTYYWQIEMVKDEERKESKIFSFEVLPSPRTVNIEGVSNTRDAGGKLAGNGYRMKEGLFYRGAKVNDITDAGREFAICDLGIKTDLDIRSSTEAAGGSPFGSDVKHINANGPYYHQIFEKEYQEALATEIKTFADPDNYPIYAHCSLGRDRTGTIVMLIQGLLGVDKNTIMMDYQLSFFSSKGCQDGAAADYMLNTNMLNAYNSISRYSPKETFSEDVEAFMLDIGVTEEEIASIKSILLEEVK